MTRAQGQDKGEGSEAARGQNRSRRSRGDPALASLTAMTGASCNVVPLCAPWAWMDRLLCLLTESLLSSASPCTPETKSYPSGSGDTGLRPKGSGSRTTGHDFSDFAFVSLWAHSIAAMTQSDSAPPTGRLVLFPVELCPGSPCL